MPEVICGIYRIHNNINGKDYIGQAIDIYHRWQQHKARYDNCAIHRAITKYGIDNFTFSILEECQVEQLDEKEIYWINYTIVILMAIMKLQEENALFIQFVIAQLKCMIYKAII